MEEELNKPKKKTKVKTPVKTTVKTTEPSTGTLVPQANGGALRYGGTNKGGTGRPRDRIRRRAVESLEERLTVANQIIDDGEAKDRDRIMGLAFLSKVGGMEQKGAITVDAELLNEFFSVIELYVHDPVELADIREKWLDVLADRIGAR